MEDLCGRLDDSAVRALLGLSVFPDPLRLEQACRRYRENAGWLLLGSVEDGWVIGCIGFEPMGAAAAIVHNLAVLPAQQRRGVGRAMVAHIIERYGLSRLELETDVDAVLFYERCGFSVTSLGERYPGVERFLCVWQTVRP